MRADPCGPHEGPTAPPLCADGIVLVVCTASVPFRLGRMVEPSRSSGHALKICVKDLLFGLVLRVAFLG